MDTDSYTLYLITKHLQCILFGCSVFVNSILLLLIIFRSPAKIGPYRYLMMTFSCYCMLFSWITVLGRPVSAAHGQVYIIFSKRKNIKKYEPWRLYLVCMYSTSIGVLMYLIAVQFFYRYCVVCKPKLLALFHGWHLGIWLIGMILVAANWMFLVRILAERTPEMEEVMRIPLLTDFHVNIDHVELIGIQFFTSHLNMRTISLIINVAILMLIFGSVTGYCAWQTYHSSKNQLAHLSYDNPQSLGNFNHQLFMALIAQTCIPSIFMFLPITLLIIIPMFSLSPGCLVSLSAISIAIYPILDPLAVIFICVSVQKRYQLLSSEGYHTELTKEMWRCCERLEVRYFPKNAWVLYQEAILSDNNYPNPQRHQLYHRQKHLHLNYITPELFSRFLFLSVLITMQSGWVIATHIIQWASLAFSLPVNLILMTMINMKSPKNIGQYRYLMMSFSVFCAIFSVLTAFGHPVFISKGYCFIIFNDIEKDSLAAPLRFLLILTYSTISGISICLTAVQFIYRYCVICKPSCIILFAGKRLLYWYLGIFIVMIDWLYLCICVAHKKPEITNCIREHVWETMEVEIDDVEYLGLQFVKEVNGKEEYNLEAIALTINVIIILGTVTCINLWCGLKTYYRSLHVVKQYDAFTHQIFFALIAQTLIPFFFMFIPILTLVCVPLMNMDTGVLMFLCTMCMAIYPILDPLAVLFIVSNYRKSLVPMLKPNRWRQIVKRKLINNQITVEVIDVDIL